jgi:hypothetical protein
MERCGSSQGLDLWVALPADRCGAAPCGAASAGGTQHSI